MKNRKNILRAGTFLAILMFLLIPLLSSPVAAANYFDVSTAYTDVYYDNQQQKYRPSVWWAGTNFPGAHSDSASGSASVVFSCKFRFRDSAPGNSSRHYGELNVQKTSTTPIGPLITARTGNQYPNGVWQRTLTISDPYNTTNLPITWTITVYVECEILLYDEPHECAYNTWTWTYTLT